MMRMGTRRRLLPPLHVVRVAAFLVQPLAPLARERTGAGALAASAGNARHLGLGLVPRHGASGSTPDRTRKPGKPRKATQSLHTKTRNAARVDVRSTTPRAADHTKMARSVAGGRLVPGRARKSQTHDLRSRSGYWTEQPCGAGRKRSVPTLTRRKVAPTTRFQRRAQTSVTCAPVQSSRRKQPNPRTRGLPTQWQAKRCVSVLSRGLAGLAMTLFHVLGTRQ